MLQSQKQRTLTVLKPKLFKFYVICDVIKQTLQNVSRSCEHALANRIKILLNIYVKRYSRINKDSDGALIIIYLGRCPDIVRLGIVVCSVAKCRGTAVCTMLADSSYLSERNPPEKHPVAIPAINIVGTNFFAHAFSHTKLNCISARRQYV